MDADDQLTRPPPAAPPDAATGRVPAGTTTILVVEDDDVIRDVARRVLERQGFAVLVAADAEAAMGLADRHPGHIHLLITDLLLPGVGGRELSARLGIHRPAIRVLYMSGSADSSVVRHRVLQPGTEFLEKPFSPALLVRTVRRVMGIPDESGESGGGGSDR